MTDDTNTPKKTVRFNVDDDSESRKSVNTVTTPYASPSSTHKKTVRFAAAEAIVPDSSSFSDTSTTSVPNNSPAKQSAPSPIPTTMSTNQNAPSPPLPPSTTASPTISPNTSPSSPPKDPSWGPSLLPSDIAAWRSARPHQVHGDIEKLDEGEKDEQGNVKLASYEPCEECGGKIVWATRGEWLLVCAGCGEPQ